MKPLAEYSPADWRRLRPITHAVKTVHIKWVDHRYRRQAARGGDIAAIRSGIRRSNVLFTVAFADAQAIEWQARLMRRYVPDAWYVIADNSPSDRDAQIIAAVAQRYAVPYIRLPENPWPASSRSHGSAMNWIWSNLIRPGEPQAFGFLDDDLYPTAPDDPFAALAKQDFYGMIRFAKPRWFLWAGFCVFRFDKVRKLPLDFGQDWFKGLDTGGGNWNPLYSRVDQTRLASPEVVVEPYKPDADAVEGQLHWVGSWLHEVGQMGTPELVDDKRSVIGKILEPHLNSSRAAASATSTGGQNQAATT